METNEQFEVTTKEQAREVISELIMRFSSNMAYDDLTEEARAAKQSIKEMADRTAGNILRSLKTRQNFEW